MDTSDLATAKALRRLTVAVWALVLVVALTAALYVVAYVPWLMSMWSGPGSDQPRAGGAYRSITPHERFHEYSIDEKIAASSVIVIAKHAKEGEKLKCVISEVLKHSPDTAFHYKVGDEYPECSRYPRPNVSYGDGMLMFFTGNPAQHRYSTSIFEDRLSGVGDMPVELLRRKIKGEAK